MTTNYSTWVVRVELLDGSLLKWSPQTNKKR
jgi:hypothetical protein